jgi:hypothetical protein
MKNLRRVQQLLGYFKSGGPGIEAAISPLLEVAAKAVRIFPWRQLHTFRSQVVIRSISAFILYVFFITH